jgi:DNA-binding NtrC family response regulator
MSLADETLQSPAEEGTTLLIADDDARTRKTLRHILEEEGYRILEAGHGNEVFRLLDEHPVDLLLLDLVMPRLDGLGTLRTLASRGQRIPVIVLSAYGTIQTAVEATRLGAYDFLEKPLDLNRTLLTIRRALNHAQLLQNHQHLLAQLRSKSFIVEQSPAMCQILELIDRVARTNVTVLIQGESGTGKDLIAQAIHAHSLRADRPYIVVNCAALPGELIESELFGYVRGAFTGASKDQTGKIRLANRGTLFLDEVGDMSLATQSKLLRMLESGEVTPLGQAQPVRVSVRVIAATNKNLITEIAAGRFREDLYHRLNVLTIQVPPLRERQEDIPTLVRHFLATFCEENGLPPKKFSPEALQCLISRPWPGNVRELKHSVQKLVLLLDGDEITGQHVSTILDGVTEIDRPTTLRDARRRFERDFIFQALAAHDWQVEQTARTLRLERTYLYKKMKELNIKPDGK